MEVVANLLLAVFAVSMLNGIRLNLYRAPDPPRYVNWCVVLGSVLGGGIIGNAVKSAGPMDVGTVLLMVGTVTLVGAFVATFVDRLNWFWLPDLRRKPG